MRLLREILIARITVAQGRAAERLIAVTAPTKK
jgi:hypothetical protein